VAGLVGLGTTGVLGLRGEPVEVVVTVVDEQVGARGAGVAVGLAAGRGGDAVGVALLVVPVLGGGPSDSDVGDLVPGVALRGGGSVVDLGGDVAGPDRVVAQQVGGLVDGVVDALAGLLLLVDDPVPGVVGPGRVARATGHAGGRGAARPAGLRV